MITTHDIRAILDHNGSLIGSGDDKIGKIGQIYLDDVTGDPEWVTVKTGLFGSGESFVPLAQGRLDGDDVVVPYGKDQIKDAPRVGDTDEHLSPEQEAELYRYYGLENEAAVSTDGQDLGTPSPSQTQSTAGHDTSGPNTDDAMTRSEERLNVGTEQVQAGKARLRKYVVTEHVTKTVPVSHEEVRLETEPITEGNRDAALTGADLTEDEHEVTLNAERVVVDKEAVPVERVKLGTETVTEDQTVEEEIGKEQIDLDDSDLSTSAGRRSRH